MPDKQAHTIPSLPVSNYSSEIARAVAWLGDRYLLAQPVNSALPRRQRLRTQVRRWPSTESIVSRF
jgi:hypothetical protein